MRVFLPMLAIVSLLTACEPRTNSGTPTVVEKNTTIVNPPAKEEKKMESHTTIINPAPAKEEKKTETTTVTSPEGTIEKKTSETVK